MLLTMKTEFCDKFGKALYVGDVVRYSLGKTGFKGQGPTLWRIIKSKKGVKLADPRMIGATEGTMMHHKYEKYLTLMDISGRDKEG